MTPITVAAPPPAPLERALRHALRNGPGRVVLRVEEPAPHRRRVARALLQEGALAAGGQVLDGPAGDLLLIGAEAHRAARLRTLLERLVGPAATATWSLDRDAPALLAYAAGARPAAPPPAPTGPDLAALDAVLDALPLSEAVHRRIGRVKGEVVFLRLEPSPDALAAALGPLSTDPDLLAHATTRIAARLLATLAKSAEAARILGPTAASRLHLPLPARQNALARTRGLGGGGPSDAPPRPRLVATLPITAAAEPATLATLATANIPLELDIPDPSILPLLAPAALPAAFLRLRWLPHLPAALAALDPPRLILTHPDPTARSFAAAHGIAVEDPAP